MKYRAHDATRRISLAKTAQDVNATSMNTPTLTRVYTHCSFSFLCTATANYKKRRQIECIGVDNIRHVLVDTHGQPEHRKGQ